MSKPYRLYQRGRTWWIQTAGRRLTTGCTDEAFAKIWALSFERREAVLDLMREDPLLRESVEAFIDETRAAKQSGHIYGISIGSQVKIGFTCRSPEKRLGQLQTGQSAVMSLIALQDGTREDEQRLHRQFRHARVRGEWFDADDVEVSEWLRKHSWYKRGPEKMELLSKGAEL